jgi:multiple sugar transport system substrate-binding protein
MPDMEECMRYRLFFLSICLLISCSDKKTDDLITIRYWAFGGTPKQMINQHDRVEKFNQAHAKIKIELSQKSWEQKRELIHTNFSAGTGPDVVHVHASYAAEFGDIGYFYAINKFADFDSIKQWYVPKLFESTRFGDNYYGLPVNAIAFILVCNGELFDELGLKPPKTWSEFRQVAKKLTRDRDGDGTIDQYGLTLMGADRGGFEYRLAPFVQKAGGRFLTPDQKHVLLDDEINIATVQLFADMYQIDHSIAPGFLGYTITDVIDQMAGNKAAMTIEGPWYPSVLEERTPDKKLYFVPVPVPDDQIANYSQAPTLQDLCMLSINSAGKHLIETWEFIKFMRCPEADLDWVTDNLGAIPVTNAAMNFSGNVKVPNLPLYKNELEFAMPWPNHPQMIAIVSNIIAPYCEKAIIGELSVKEALQTAARETRAIIASEK